jgi:hypothetical protein
VGAVIAAAARLARHACRHALTRPLRLVDVITQWASGEPRTPNRPKERTVSAEDDAQSWHDQRAAADLHHEQFSACWCCCWSCDPNAAPPGNPHYTAAQASLRADMAEGAAPTEETS